MASREGQSRGHSLTLVPETGSDFHTCYAPTSGGDLLLPSTQPREDGGPRGLPWCALTFRGRLLTML